MIFVQLKSIVINLLFGAFISIIFSTIEYYENKKPIKVVFWFIYFFTTIALGILYVAYLDKIFFPFNFYYLLFIVLGYSIAYNGKFFKMANYLKLFNFVLRKLLSFFKWLALFSINYSMIKQIKKKLVVFKKNDIR